MPDFALPVRPREIIHLDADAFFASVEQRDDPKLQGRPVAVGTGVVASCSYEARRYGVRTAMRLAEAKQLCRPLIVVPGEYPRYELTARRILACCLDRTPVVEAAALDDLYLDVTNGRFASREALAKELREQVHEEIQISISVGMASNKLTAQVATRQAKPGRHVKVPIGTEQEYLAPWAIDVLPGVGRKTQHRLHRLNVHQVGEMARMPCPILQQLFGRQGRTFHEYSHGIDWRPVRPNRPATTISRCTSFNPPVGDLDYLRAMLKYLLERATVWMRYQKLAARGLTVTIRYGDYESAVGYERFAQPTGRDDAIWEVVADRFARLYTRRLPLRLLGVELTSLISPRVQGSLYADTAAQREQRLTACKDAIRKRFGFMSLTSANALSLTATNDHSRASLLLRTPCLTR